MFISIPITEQMRIEATTLASNIPKLNNSITKGDGTYSGCIGEIATRIFLNKNYDSDAEIVGHYDYDILAKKNNLKIEVKTKRCSFPPRPHFECSVSNFNDKQNCDFYVFTRADFKNVYLLGFLSKKDFITKSRQMIKGREDSNQVNGKNFSFHANCRNVYISDLKPFSQKPS